MRVMNAMLGRGRGGLEESFVVYHEALQAAGHEVISLLDPRAAVWDEVQRLCVGLCPVRIGSHWDPLSLWRVRRALERFRPDVIVSHGNRAGRLLLRASKGRWPVLARLPNDRFRRILRCDGFLAILKCQVRLLEHAGVPRERIFHVPSMLRALPPQRSRIAHHPPVLGAMGRFHPVKGLDVYLRALAWLRRQWVAFSAVLAGDGELRPALQKLSFDLGLGDLVRFPGWVSDRAAFFLIQSTCSACHSGKRLLPG